MTTPATAHALNATPHWNPAGPGPARQDDTLAYYVGMAQRARLLHAQAQAFSGVLPSPPCGAIFVPGSPPPVRCGHPHRCAPIQEPRPVLRATQPLPGTHERSPGDSTFYDQRFTGDCSTKIAFQLNSLSMRFPTAFLCSSPVLTGAR